MSFLFKRNTIQGAELFSVLKLSLTPTPLVICTSEVCEILICQVLQIVSKAASVTLFSMKKLGLLS